MPVLVDVHLAELGCVRHAIPDEVVTPVARPQSLISGKNMNWFFQNWFFDNGYIDIGLAGAVTKNVGGTDVTIKNIGGKAVPVNFVVTYADGTTETIHKTAAIWQADQRTANVNLTTPKPVKAITLDTGIWMDANPDDNKWEAK